MNCATCGNTSIPNADSQDTSRTKSKATTTDESTTSNRPRRNVRSGWTKSNSENQTPTPTLIDSNKSTYRSSFTLKTSISKKNHNGSSKEKGMAPTIHFSKTTSAPLNIIYCPTKSTSNSFSSFRVSRKGKRNCTPISYRTFIESTEKY